jgi:hypothetical protein
VARGDADLVIVVATCIVDVGGVDMVGPIPEELQTKIGFAAGLQSSRTAALAPLPLKTLISAACASEAMTKRPPANARHIFMASPLFSPSSA